MQTLQVKKYVLVQPVLPQKLTSLVPNDNSLPVGGKTDEKGSY